MKTQGMSTRTVCIKLGQEKTSAQIRQQHSNAVLDRMFKFGAFGPSWLVPFQATGTVFIGRR